VLALSGVSPSLEGQDGRTASPVPGEAAEPIKGGPPMSQQEVLEFLSQRIGSDPWRHPKKAETVAELAATIRKRGVSFRYQSTSDFASKLTNSGGNESTIPFAIQDNFGVPNTVEWLHGTWDLVKIAPSIVFEKGGWLYRRGEMGAKEGVLTIKADGTYDWNGIKGRHRLATEQETAMSYRGGGSVSSSRPRRTGLDRPGKTGRGWIVVQNTSRGTMQEFGSRRGK
jgi:hypothetical protein